MGFSMPIDEWLRGSLREWAEDLLHPDLLHRQALLELEPVAQVWDEHTSGSHNWQKFLWNLLVFQTWHSSFLNRPRAASGIGTSSRAARKDFAKPH